jgi:hypothetical protein
MVTAVLKKFESEWVAMLILVNAEDVNKESITYLATLTWGLDFCWFEDFANHIRVCSDPPPGRDAPHLADQPPDGFNQAETDPAPPADAPHLADQPPDEFSRGETAPAPDDRNCRKRCADRWAGSKHWVQMVVVWVFTIIQVGTIVDGIVLCVEHPSLEFGFVIALRIAVIPALAFFHPLSSVFFHARNDTISLGFPIGGVGSVVLLMILVGVRFRASSYISNTRFDSLPPLPANWSNVPAFPSADDVCNAKIHGISILDALGLAFGGYEIQRSPTLFLSGLEHFFGPNASQLIRYEAEELDTDIPLVVYNVSGVSMFAFRGFSTIPELGLQFEMLARHHVLPIANSVMPLYDAISRHFLSWYTQGISKFGSRWFRPRPIYAKIHGQGDGGVQRA